MYVIILCVKTTKIVIKKKSKNNFLQINLIYENFLLIISVCRNLCGSRVNIKQVRGSIIWWLLLEVIVTPFLGEGPYPRNGPTHGLTSDPDAQTLRVPPTHKLVSRTPNRKGDM